MCKWECIAYARWAWVQHGEILAEVQETWPPGIWEYRGRRFTSLEAAKRAAEKAAYG